MELPNHRTSPAKGAAWVRRAEVMGLQKPLQPPGQEAGVWFHLQFVQVVCVNPMLTVFIFKKCAEYMQFLCAHRDGRFHARSIFGAEIFHA